MKGLCAVLIVYALTAGCAAPRQETPPSPPLPPPVAAALPEPTPPPEVFYVAVRDLPLRESPQPLASRVGTVGYGEQVEVVERQRDWRRVRVEGWVHKSSLRRANLTESPISVEELEEAVRILMKRLETGGDRDAQEPGGQ